MVAGPLERVTASPPGQLSRRRAGAIVLAVIGLLALMRLRASCETVLSFGSEMAVQFLILLVCVMTQRKRGQALANYSRAALATVGTLIVVIPWLLQVLLRLWGDGTGLELVALSSFGWATLLATLFAQRARSLGTCVVCSGFLTLLVTCSSDQWVALVLAFSWGAVCLWWLASAQWERALRCQVSTVQETRWQRPLVVLLGCAVFALAAWSVAGRFPASQKLPWELAPTSGGTGATDPFARSGVGDGDALVAARENAASFGAVDSDLLLDSKEASLFDLYSDTFGEPVRKTDVERTVALAPNQTEVAEPTHMAQSDGASAALTTQRRPAPPSKPLSNRPSDALLFWIGRPDTHLALERFTDFDGLQWSAQFSETRERSPSTSKSNDMTGDKKILPVPHGNQTWFTVGDDSTSTGPKSNLFCGSSPEAIKVARLRSPRMVSLAGMHSWHIHQVEDGTFFRVDRDDNLTMQGRQSVPEYTIVRYVNREIDLESLTLAMDQAAKPVPSATVAASAGEQLARSTARQWQSELARRSSWDRVQAIMERLRSEFHLDRHCDTSQSADPLADFLSSRRGNDLMFATAAAVMLQELGYQTRLVTGLMARRENRLNWGQELAVFASDTHAWLEIQAGSAWIPLEPSPGFPQPVYHISWPYWFRLHAWTFGWWTLAIISCLALAHWQRIWLFEGCFQLLALVCWIGSDRMRCRWLLMILDARSGLIGYKRPAHVPPSRWYQFLSRGPEPLVSGAVANSTCVFFREADRLWFGRQTMLSPTAREACRVLWTQTSCRLLRELVRSSNTSALKS